MKIVAVVKSIVAECDEKVAEASRAIGGKDECSEAQITDIVESVCTNREHETDAAVRESVRAALKAKAYVYKPEKVAK